MQRKLQHILHHTRNYHLRTQCPFPDEDIEYISQVPYSSVVGSLMYVLVYSHSDISYAMSLVSRYMTNPVKEH
jgi:hypothetical protein